ncbi:MAG: type II secretion system F family protein, partial [Synergistales bacterium]|nr:type II secretion system F family protein [Synergistales bacterium]
MPLFAYQAIDRTGVQVSGKLEADHDWAVAERLQKMGYVVVDITRVGKSWVKTAFRVQRRVSLGDLGMFSRQLAAMIGAGIPLTRALYALGEQAVNPTLSRVLRDVARNVEGGLSLSESMNAYPEVFSPMYVDMVRAGEVGGKLEEVLHRLSEQLERDKSLRDSIRGATFYPLAVIVFATCVLLVMLFVVVPIFMRLFPQGIPLPLPTRMIIA